MHYGLGIGLLSLASFQAWVLMPNLSLALAAYAAAPAVIAAGLWWAVRYKWDILYLIAAASFLAASAIPIDANLCRALMGVPLLALAVLAWRVADHPYGYALAFGLTTEPVVWLAGNLLRGTWTEPVASSAIGQAFGAYAWGAQLLLIALGYVIAWRRIT